jgi:hypothetical protein
MQHALTRSVVVINLSRYLQTLTLTGYQMLKHYNHLITNIIVTRYINQPHATLQIPRHTRRPTGTTPFSQPGQSTGGLRRVTFTTTTAVPLVSITAAGISWLIVHYTLIRLPPVVCGINWITWLFYYYGILPWFRTLQIDRPQTSWRVSSSFCPRW